MDELVQLFGKKVSELKRSMLLRGSEIVEDEGLMSQLEDLEANLTNVEAGVNSLPSSPLLRLTLLSRSRACPLILT